MNIARFTFLLHILMVMPAFTQHVIMVVIDGARFTETLGSQATYIPNMWNTLKPQGTIYTNFYNNGSTRSLPGHAAILTGNWEDLANDGSERPNNPTIFEYNRHQTASMVSDNYVLGGATKFNALTYSNHFDYGAVFGASSNTNSYEGDLATYDSLVGIMDMYHPELLLVNFKEVDTKGHSGNFQEYVAAIQQVDSLIFLLWQKISTDPFYMNNTTLFVTNDHGRHDDDNGGFEGHDDSCGGCRHIMLLTLGRYILPNQIINDTTEQIDIAPTVAELLSIDPVFSAGTSLLPSNVSIQAEDELNHPSKVSLLGAYPNPFNPSTTVGFYLPKEQLVKIDIIDIQGHNVIVLQNGKKSVGYHEVTWTGKDQRGETVNTGVYLCRLHTGIDNITIKLVYMK
jgi:hypothetical protein